MKALSIAAAIVAAAAFCAGMIDTNSYVTTEHVAKVAPGECLDEIAGRYYKQDDRKIVFDEFRTEVWTKNKNLVAHRQLQPGDKVVVVVHRYKK